jgi:hypothetical protein
MQGLIARRAAILVLEGPVAADLIGHLEAVERDAAVGKGFGRGEAGATGPDDADFGKHENLKGNNNGPSAHDARAFVKCFGAPRTLQMHAQDSVFWRHSPAAGVLVELKRDRAATN